MKHPRADGVDPAARSRARPRARQGLYAWQMSASPVDKVIEQFRAEQDMEVADLEYFEALVRGVVQHADELDAVLSKFIDRTVAQVDPIERAVLRIAGFELAHRPDVPYRVVINEAIETTKRFGAEHGHTYVNGVLDRAAAEWRPQEMQSAKR